MGARQPHEVLFEGLAGLGKVEWWAARADEQGGDLVRCLECATVAQLEQDPTVVERPHVGHEACGAEGRRRSDGITCPDLQASVAVAVERRRVELLDEPSAVDDPNARREPIDLGEDVARHEHGHALVTGERTKELADLDDTRRIEPVRRFVEHEQLGTVDEGAGQGEPLEVAERELASPTAGIVAEGEAVDELVDAA